MKRFFIILLAFSAVLCGCSQNGGRPETVARKFCEAMYDNDMARAKTYMVPEYAKRTPDVIQATPKQFASYKRSLKRAKCKVFPDEYLPDMCVTVRFYIPSSPKERWLACSMEMEKVDGCWKVTTYGY